MSFLKCNLIQTELGQQLTVTYMKAFSLCDRIVEVARLQMLHSLDSNGMNGYVSD